MMKTVPQNVPQRHANQALHARYALHARTFLLSDFVSIENKGSKIQIPKLKVASSSLVARSTLLNSCQTQASKVLETSKTFRELSLYLTVSL